jgi:hypothetical protein
MTAAEISDEERVAGGYSCKHTGPGGHCQFRASRPSGMCGTHDNARQRAADRQAADARRAEYARTSMRRVSPVVRALVALGIDAQPRLSGVLITIEGAERLIARLTATEGAAQ